MMRSLRVPVACVVATVIGVVWLSAIPLSAQAGAMARCTTANARAAVNNAVTLTLTPPDGQHVYLCGWELTVSQNGTSTANTNLVFTSTNLGGWAYAYSLAATANLSLTHAVRLAWPVKSTTATTAVTFVSPAAQTNTAFSISAFYFYDSP